jgi:hypothetical protein
MLFPLTLILSLGGARKLVKEWIPGRVGNDKLKLGY